MKKVYKLKNKIGFRCVGERFLFLQEVVNPCRAGEMVKRAFSSIVATNRAMFLLQYDEFHVISLLILTQNLPIRIYCQAVRSPMRLF